MKKRRKLLTASKFGEICKARDTTLCAVKVMNILYPPELDLPQLTYGLEMEKIAITQLENKMNIKVEASGLLINTEKPYLGASLDGKVNEDGIVEIKSPSIAENMTPLKAIKEIKRIRNIYDEKDINKLNRKHTYYYQVQGSLHSSKRNYCLFVLFTRKGIHIVKEEYDNQFWEVMMEPKLTRFYMECLLPEIVDSRIRRNMPIKEPEYILNAIKEKEMKKSLKLQNKDTKKVVNTIKKNP